MRRHTNQRRGSAITEFALVSTVLLLIMAGGTDLARVFNLGTKLTQAVKAGAQYGQFSSRNAGNTAGIAAAAQAAAPGITMTVTTTRECLCGTTTMTCGDTSCATEPIMYVTVSAASDFDAYVPYWGMSDNFPVSASMKLRVK